VKWEVLCYISVLNHLENTLKKKSTVPNPYHVIIPTYLNVFQGMSIMNVQFFCNPIDPKHFKELDYKVLHWDD